MATGVNVKMGVSGVQQFKQGGFTGFDGRSVMPILQQRLIKNARPATQVMIDTYMAPCRALET